MFAGVLRLLVVDLVVHERRGHVQLFAYLREALGLGPESRECADALLTAARRGFVPMVDYLLSTGVPVDGYADRPTALMLACANGFAGCSTLASFWPTAQPFPWRLGGNRFTLHDVPGSSEVFLHLVTLLLRRRCSA